MNFTSCGTLGNKLLALAQKPGKVERQKNRNNGRLRAWWRPLLPAHFGYPSKLAWLGFEGEDASERILQNCLSWGRALFSRRGTHIAVFSQSKIPVKCSRICGILCDRLKMGNSLHSRAWGGGVKGGSFGRAWGKDRASRHKG